MISTSGEALIKGFMMNFVQEHCGNTIYTDHIDLRLGGNVWIKDESGNEDGSKDTIAVHNALFVTNIYIKKAILVLVQVSHSSSTVVSSVEVHIIVMIAKQGSCPSMIRVLVTIRTLVMTNLRSILRISNNSSTVVRSVEENNRILEEMLRTQMSNSPVVLNEPEGSDDYTEGEQVVDFLMENIDVAGLPRHLVKRLFSHLLKNPSLTKGMSDEPLGDDTKPRSFDATFSNPLFDFNDDFTLCNNNPLFDEEFEGISSLDLPELTPVIDESTLLVILPSPYLVVLGDEKINLLLRDDLYTLLTGDREIDFNPCRAIEELECLLAKDPVPVPRVFDEPLGNSDSMSRPIVTNDLILEELTTEIGLDDLISTDIDGMYYNSEGDILYFEKLLNEDTSFDVSQALLPTESSLLIPPLSNPKQICLREVERFDPFFSLTQSGGKTRVMETPSFSSHHMPSPRPTAYSPKEVMYCYYHPHLTSGDGFDHGPKMK
ncbi:hypothetical protein Tco_0221263 [Tanacetum coccineum]